MGILVYFLTMPFILSIYKNINTPLSAIVDTLFMIGYMLILEKIFSK